LHDKEFHARIIKQMQLTAASSIFLLFPELEQYEITFYNPRVSAIYSTMTNLKSFEIKIIFKKTFQDSLKNIIQNHEASTIHV